MAGINVLVVVGSAQGDSGKRYLSWKTTERDGVIYDARMTTFPEITLALSHPRGGVQQPQDALSFTFQNMDGALSDWLDGTNDPRGYAVQAYYLPLGDGTPEQPDTGTPPTLFFEGTCSDIVQDGSADGTITVTLAATSIAADKMADQLPSVIIDARTFNDADEEDFVPQESLGLQVPVVFGATREHVPLYPVRRNPDAAEWFFCAMHDAQVLELMRGYVNTVYRLYSDNNGSKLAVVPENEWKQWLATYAEITDVRPERSYVMVGFSAFDPANLYYDGEVTEFNSALVSVKRHWLFRRSLADEKKAALLYPVSASALADWRFENDLTDSSGNGNTLSLGSAESGGPYYVFEDDREFAYGVRQTHGTRFELVTSGAALFDFDKTTKCRIEVDLRAYADGDVWRVTGPLLVKSDGTSGYALEASDGYVTFKLMSSTGNVSVTTKKRVKGDRMDTITAYIDPASATIGILLNGELQATVSTATIGTDPASSEVLRFFRDGVTGFRAQGVCGRVQIFDSLPDETCTWENGQSNTVESAVRLGTGVTLREYADTAADIDIDTDHGFTFLAWIKRPETPADEIIVKRRAGSGPGFVLEVASGFAKVTISDGTNTATVTGAVSLDDEEWHLIIATFNRFGDDTLNLYVDGEPDGSADGSSVGDLSNDEDMEIGGVSALDELMLMRNATIPMPAITAKRYYGAARGNPARVIARCLRDETWGLDLPEHAASFLAVQDQMEERGIFFAGALYDGRTALDVLSELCATYGMSLRITGGAWGLFWFDALSEGVEAKYAGYHDGLWNNVQSVSTHRRLASKDIPKRLVCLYQRINDPAIPKRVFSQQTFVRTVSETATGKTQRVGLMFVRRGTVADRICDYLTKWTAGDEQTNIVSDYELVDVNLGHPLWFSAPLLGIVEKLWRVTAKRLMENGIQFSIIEDVDTSSYSAQPIYPDLVPQTEPDYRYTEPPAPFDLYLFANRPFVAGAVIGIRFSMPDDATTRAIVRRADVKFRYTDEGGTELDEDEYTHQVVDVVPGETRSVFVKVDSGRDIEVIVAALSRYDVLSAQALTTAAGLTAEGGDTALAFTTAEDGTVQRSASMLDQRVAALEAGSGAGGPYIREIPEQSGPYSDGEVIVRIPHAVDHDVPVNFGDSKFYCSNGPDVGAGDAVVTVKQNGVTVGTATYAEGCSDTDPATLSSSGYSATAGDFELVAPSPPVAGFAGVRATIVGTRA